METESSHTPDLEETTVTTVLLEQDLQHISLVANRMLELSLDVSHC